MKRTQIFIFVLFLTVFSSCQDSLNTQQEEYRGKVDTLYVEDGDIGRMVSIQEYGVLPTNSASVNKTNLQKAIDAASKSGMALYVTPCENGYPCDGGIVLKTGVTLIGSHGPTGRGTRNAKGNGPTGSLFVIKDRSNAFISVNSSTRVQGIQFYYPEQTNTNGAAIIAYKPTIKVAGSADDVTIKNLSFYGEYIAMDFRAEEGFCSSRLLFENCYGYPLSGKFIMIDRCSDSPRILHCHINPANMREFGRAFSLSVNDKVISTRSFAYSLDHTGNAVLMDVFTFGSYGGIYLGPDSRGQLTSFNLDCVNVGVFKDGYSSSESNWEISQGSIIANVGTAFEYIHPFIVTGEGHTTISNVDAFSGTNGAVTALGKSYDYIYITGQGEPTISLTSCSMRNYVAAAPITLKNGKAKLRAVSCSNGENKFFNLEYDGGGEPAEIGDDTYYLE